MSNTREHYLAIRAPDGKLSFVKCSAGRMRIGPTPDNDLVLPAGPNEQKQRLEIIFDQQVEIKLYQDNRETLASPWPSEYPQSFLDYTLYYRHDLAALRTYLAKIERRTLWRNINQLYLKEWLNRWSIIIFICVIIWLGSYLLITLDEHNEWRSTPSGWALTPLPLPTSTSIPTPTPTLAPTLTALPTNTPPPTWTTQPTQTPTATAIPSPTSTALPTESVPNIGDAMRSLAINVQLSGVSVGQDYWQVVAVEPAPNEQFGGKNGIFVQVLDANGQPDSQQTVLLLDANQTVVAQRSSGDKLGEGYACDFPFFSIGAVYSLKIAGLPSQRVSGLGLLNISGAPNSFLIKFQRTKLQ
jgi:hypothetical protein